MGVIGLTHYVSTVAGLHQSIKVKNQPVVFDGCALIYYLYRHFSLDQRCGGQYVEYHAVVIEFFRTIKKCGVVPYVVIDGHRSPKKTETVVSRRTSSVRQVSKLVCEGKRHHYTKFNVVLPIFAREVFIRCLKSLNVIYFVSHGESDGQAVTLANYIRCPVISQDSDYYIQPIHYGYIPLDSIEYLEGHMLCSVSKRYALAAHLKIRESLLPVFACLVGNDYISRDVLKKVYTALGFSYKESNKNFAIITNVAVYLSRFKSSHEVWDSIKEASGDVDIKDLLTLFMEVADDYSALTKKPVKLESLENSFESAADVSKKLMFALNNVEPRRPYFAEMWMGLIEPWIIDVVLWKSHFLPVQVEKMNARSSHSCSLNLRKKLYSMLFINWQLLHNSDPDAEFEVREYDRQDVKYGSKLLRILPDILFISVIDGNGSIKNIPLTQRRTLFLEALSLKIETMEQMNGLDSRHLLFCLALKFWILNCRPRENLRYAVLSVLMCTVRLFYGRVRAKSSHYSYSLESQHLFAQLQSVLYFSQALNGVLHFPFDELNICYYYNGVLLHRCAGDLRTGKPVENMLTPEEMLLYKDFIVALKPEFDPDDVTSKSSDTESAETKEENSESERDEVPELPSALKGNRFAALSQS